MLYDREYQTYAWQAVFEYFRTKYGNPLIAMPTGTGKSVVIARMCQMVMQYPNQKVIIATHVKELVQQNYNKMMDAWPQAPAGIYSAGLKKKDVYSRIVFAGIKSIYKRAIDFGKVDILMIDEAHLVSPTEETCYLKFINDLKKINPLLKVVGLTATPWRVGHGKLTECGIFTDIAVDMTGIDAFNWFIQEGYLVRLVPKPTTTQFNISGVHVQAGEFNLKELQSAIADQEEVTRQALQETIYYGQNRRKWLFFCAGVQHAKFVAAELNGMGIRCALVHSDMEDDERDKVIADFKAGHYQAIANNNILTTGFDDAEIDMIVVLRHTMSAILWVQMLGRGTRPLFVGDFDLNTTEGRLQAISASGKLDCLVLDFAYNAPRLGPINDPVIPRKKGEKGGTAPIKLCTNCNCYNHASLRECEFCHQPFSFAVKIKTEASQDQLIKDTTPVVEVFEVGQITYAKQEKAGGSQSVRVTYYCNLRRFNEWVPINGNPGLAKRWWASRVREAGIGYDTFPMPSSVDEALSVINKLPVPTHIRVHTNVKYPAVLAACFDGSKFGEQEKQVKKISINVDAELHDKPWNTTPADDARDNAKMSQLQTRRTNAERQDKNHFDDMDDDIPF